MVMIACKAPNGLVLNLDRYEVAHAANGVVRRVRGDQRVTLAGWAHEHNKPDMTEGSGGYRLTPVPADFWTAWLKLNPDSPLIADRIILPPPKGASEREALAQSIDHKAVPKMFPPAREGDVPGVVKADR